jgi:hypothetical protein
MNAKNQQGERANHKQASGMKPYEKPSITARERLETVAATCQGGTAKALGNTSCQFLNS